MILADGKLKEKLSILLPALNEKQKRLLVGAEAIALGYGGIKCLSDITGMSTNTITREIHEIESGNEDVSRIRSKGSGRKTLTIKHPDIKLCIEDIIEPDTRGDPESPLRWTCKSVRNISDFLLGKGYSVVGNQWRESYAKWNIASKVTEKQKKVRIILTEINSFDLSVRLAKDSWPLIIQ